MYRGLRTCISLAYQTKHLVDIQGEDILNDLPHSSHINFDLSSRDLLGNSESSRVYDFDGTSYLLRPGDLGKCESKWMWRIIGNDHVLVYVIWGRLCCWLKLAFRNETRFDHFAYRGIYRVRLQECDQRVSSCQAFQNSWR